MLCLKFPEYSRKDLYAKILCEEVFVNNEKVREAKRLVLTCSTVRFRQKTYVSRGGIKLGYVLNKWKIRAEGKIFLDAGCSKGGFTDCLLKNGAESVYAVDVGYNQLSYSLRIDERVRLFERTNIMNINQHSLDPKPHMAVCDLSFRSLYGAASHMLDLVISDMLIALVKPQFEWVNPPPEFKGVVKDNRTIIMICENLVKRFYNNGVYVSSVELSPICGVKGNQELFFLLKKKKEKEIETVFMEIANLFSDK